MNILLIMDPGISVPPLRYGGIERIVYLLANAYARQGHNVTLLAGPNSHCDGQTIAYGVNEVDGSKWNRTKAIAFVWAFLLKNTFSMKQNHGTQPSAPARFDLIHNFGRLVYLLPVLRVASIKIMSYQRKITTRNTHMIQRLRPRNFWFTACSDNCRSLADVGNASLAISHNNNKPFNNNLLNNNFNNSTTNNKDNITNSLNNTTDKHNDTTHAFKNTNNNHNDINTNNNNNKNNKNAQKQRFTQWETIHNTVDFSKYQHHTTFDEHAPLMFLGRLDPIKGAHTAIKVAKETGSRLWLAGNITNTPAGQAYYSETLAPEIDGTQIIYLGELDDKQKSYYLSRSKALLFPIEWEEPFGIVMIEAMACGTPVIAFNKGAVPEVVTPGRTGFIVEDTPAMINAVHKLKRLDRGLCRDTAMAKFDINIIARKYLELAVQGRESTSVERTNKIM
jgi:glycosyltransferase involved in cell wall biosynthesis